MLNEPPHIHIYIYIYIYIEASCVSSHTEELWYNETVCPWMTVYTLLSQGLTFLEKELTAATPIMQSSSNELSTPVSSYIKCKKKTKQKQES